MSWDSQLDSELTSKYEYSKAAGALCARSSRTPKAILLRCSLDRRVVAWFAVGGVPMALIGGFLFVKAPLTPLTRGLGVFLILIVVWRHSRLKTRWCPTIYSFAGIGAGASFLSALLDSVGPLMAPFFLAYGLVKGAYIGTEALSTVVMHITKLIAYRGAAVLPLHAVVVGLMLGPIMILGSFTGKRIVDRLSETAFIWVVEAAFVLFLWKAWLHFGIFAHFGSKEQLQLATVD